MYFILKKSYLEKIHSKSNRTDMMHKNVLPAYALLMCQLRSDPREGTIYIYIICRMSWLFLRVGLYFAI